MAAKHAEDIPRDSSGNLVFPDTGSFNLVNLYIGYQITPFATAALSVENLLNEKYANYTTAYPNELTQTIVAFPEPGITIKGSLKILFGEELLRSAGGKN